MRFIPWFTAIGLASSCLSQTSPAPKGPVDQLIPWLLNEDQQLRGISFSELIFDATGRKVLPFTANNAVDQRVAKAISVACDETMKRLNAPRLPVCSANSHSQPTVNSNVQGTRIYVSPMWRANACSTWTRSFTPSEVATAVSAHFISSRRSRRIKCATTQCISSLDLSMRRAKLHRVRRKRGGTSRDGISSIFRALQSN